MRVTEKITSSAENDSPPWNFTFGRRWKRQVVGFGCSHFVASAGNQLEILAAPDQRLVDLAEPRQREGLGQRMRIERGRIDAIGVSECLGVGLRGCDGQREREHCNPDALHRRSPTWMTDSKIFLL